MAYLTLKKAYDAALWSDRKSFRNSSWIDSVLAWANSEIWHCAAVVATGALGGIGGAATTVVELPVTTALILHSVQQIAISYGKDPSDLEVRQQCIAVFALGGSLEDDADAEFGFWGVRFGIGQQTVAQLPKRIAPRFGVAVSEKFLAEAAPLLGAAGGAFINFAFADFYQKMAHVHFRLQAVEERHDRDQVKSCFQRIVADLRQ